jgi:hypothetical protein
MVPQPFNLEENRRLDRSRDVYWSGFSVSAVQGTFGETGDDGQMGVDRELIKSLEKQRDSILHELARSETHDGG